MNYSFTVSFSNSAIRVWTKSLSGSFFLPTVFSGVNIDISTKCSISFLTIRESGETFTADQRSRKKYKLRKYHTIDRRRSQHWRAVSLREFMVSLVVTSLIAAILPPVILDTYWLGTKLLLVPTYHTIAGNHFRPPHRLLQIFWDLIWSEDFLTSKHLTFLQQNYRVSQKKWYFVGKWP